MTHSALTIWLGILCITTASCSTTKNAAAPDDPFVGFFAHPGFGMLELTRDGAEGKYRGKMHADYGPFPVELTRDGNVARGTVTIAGEARPFQVENTPAGLFLTESGTRAEEPLKRYRDMNAYQKWFEAQGGYRAEGTIDESWTPPATQPSR